MTLIKVPADELTGGAEYCRQLEQGGIVFFEQVPFEIPRADLDLLLSIRQENTRLHKNISFRPKGDTIRGSSAADRDDGARLREIMQGFSQRATAFLRQFLSPYAGKLVLDYASFRPIEEAGRVLPLHKRNELLHVDAFPSRPTRGGRILRFFANVNPVESRIWQVGENFERVAEQYAEAAGLTSIARRERTTAGRLKRDAIRALGKVGLPLPDRSAYDRFMLRFHDHMKEDARYQETSQKTRLEFPPNSAWMVYTDCVPHSVLSGRFALEQTFIVPFDALVAPDSAPVSILERQCGLPLTSG